MNGLVITIHAETWRTSVRVIFLAAALGLVSCSTLPRPGAAKNAVVAGAPDAGELVRASALQAGDAWGRERHVTVSFDGKWWPIVERVQPGLVDSGFRKRSEETYDASTGRVVQVYTGPKGKKRVERLGEAVDVVYEPEAGVSEEQRASAALVADAYSLFVFRSSWLAERGSDFKVIGRRKLNGEACWLVEAVVRPGFGFSAGDHVIAWIGGESLRTHRVQLTLMGLESTAMADVDVTFGDYESHGQGTEWPGHYLEKIQRPFLARAHEWELLDLEVN